MAQQLCDAPDVDAESPAYVECCHPDSVMATGEEESALHVVRLGTRRGRRTQRSHVQVTRRRDF
jgi:hypothetical protein